MKKQTRISLSLFSLLIVAQFLYAGGTKKMSPLKMVENLHWLGQAAFKISLGDKTIYIDPYRIKNKDKADIILISHEHSDHLSIQDIKKIIYDNTILIAPQTCENALKDIFVKKTILLTSGKDVKVDDINIEAVPAYNIKKTNFHPKENQWLGYILTINDVRIYHAGDTERIPEMKNINCDIALLPLGQTYTMNSVKEAAEVALDVKAKIAIPMHYGLYEATQEDATTFKNILKDKIKVILLKEQ